MPNLPSNTPRKIIHASIVQWREPEGKYSGESAYTVGGGVEGKFLSWLPANWSWKLEYLYLDLGSLNYSAPVGGIFPFVFPLPVSGTIAMHTHFNENIVRVGLNYKFGN